MDTLQAAIVLAKLEIFDAEVEARGRIGSCLAARLQSVGIDTTSADARQYERLCSVHSRS